VDWAKAGVASAAMPMAKVLAAAVRAVLRRMAERIPVAGNWLISAQRDRRIGVWSLAGHAHTSAAPPAKQGAVTDL
jgi:hypothetical protein